MTKKSSKSTLFACLSMLLSTQSPIAQSDTWSENKWLGVAQNPLSPVFSLPMQYTHHGGAEAGDIDIGSFQPIIPVSLGNWNMINQLKLNIMGTPGVVNGIAELPEPFPGDGVVGLADSTFTSYFTPAFASDDFSFGIGPTFVLPTDTLFTDIEDRRSRELGGGKFSVGPAVMLVTQPRPWTLGLGIKQVWSVFGSDTRESVSQMILEPFVNYNLGGGWYLASDMDIISNWYRDNDQRWTVPVGAGVGKLFTVGDNAINTRLEGYYNPVRPDQSPEWSANFTLQVLFAK